MLRRITAVCIFIIVMIITALVLLNHFSKKSQNVNRIEKTTAETIVKKVAKPVKVDEGDKDETKVTETSSEEETTETFEVSYYVIVVNLAYNQVVVYTRGDKINNGYDENDPKDDEYELIAFAAFACSPGTDAATPEGTYYLGDRSKWCFMEGDVYAKYATRISDSIMFHSVPYRTRNSGDLKTYDYNILGYNASSGCIRLNCRDAKWIFDNCAIGTEVRILYDWSSVSPIEVNETYLLPEGIEQLNTWDPTDIEEYDNPWLTYNAYLKTCNVEIPINSSVDYLLECLGPYDDYGNNLSDYFYTDGGYNLYEEGVYTTTGHIKLGNLSFSYPLTITVTDDISESMDTEEYSETENVRDENINMDLSDESENSMVENDDLE